MARRAEQEDAAGRGLTRRGLLGGAAAAGAGFALGGVAFASREESDAPVHRTVPFFGDHQAGITTPAQDRLHFAAFDLITDDPRDVRALLRAWTEAAARMSEGRPAGPVNDQPVAPPDDTGEAFDLPPARLTVTIGFGPGLFERGGHDRYGLASKRPAALKELPPLPGDELDPERSGGDLCVQACADDPQVAFHAVRNLARIARGVAVMRWSQLGFGRTSTTSRAQDTPRNLMGFKDGTNNIVAEDQDGLGRFVWAGDEAPAWMRGGSYVVTRRIRMLIEVWDRNSLRDQEDTFGRFKDTGAPYGGKQEHDPVDLRARGSDGELLIPSNAHIRLAAPQSNGGTRLLRRGYSFTDGFDAQLGQLDAGLFFIAFQRDPEQFVRVQNNLARDGLNEYVKHVSSAVFAIPPGARRGGYLGQGLI